MADTFKKIDREFVLGDSSLNSYSYRLLTSGYLMDEFKKNPIGYHMHGKGEFTREQGVLVKWDDLRMQDDKVYGKPCINLNHPRGQRTVDEIESGFLNAASFGQLVALEISSNPADYLEGQTGPTISKWYNRECSLVDVPGNYNATAQDLVDENDKPIDLSDFNTQKFNMEKIFLTPAQLAAIPNLKADADQATVNIALQDLIAKAGKVDGLTTELATANTAKETAETDLTDLKTATATKEVADLAATALKEGRITKEGADKLVVQYAGKPVELKDLLSAFQPYKGIVANLNPAAKNVADLVAKDYDELDKSGKLEDLLAAAPDEFYSKYENRFSKKHPNDPSKK